MKISLRKDNLSPEPNIIDIIDGQILKDDIKQFNEMLDKTLEKQKPYLTETELSLYGRGKKLRPMMLLLFSRMLSSPDTPLPGKVIKGAVALEMLHVATLIHDDIIDGALQRRGLPSVNAAHGVETAIIIGDMQFVQSIRAFVDTINVQEDMGLVKLVLDTAYDICCGELDELNTNKNLKDYSIQDLKERYMKTIDRKTAILFGLACEAGASLIGSRTSDARRAGFYGRRFGRAFQIMDDIFDFTQDSKKSGKGKGTDLVNRTLSLPIIYAMDEAKAGNGGKGDVMDIMLGETPPTEQAVCEGIKTVMQTDAIYKAYTDARSFAMESVSYLRFFPQNRYTQALQDLSWFIVNRI